MKKMGINKYKIIEPYINKHCSLLQISSKNSISIRTLSRWVKSYRENRELFLTKKDRADKNKTRKISEELINFTQGLALEWPKSVASIHRQVCEIANKIKEERPSYALIYNIVKSIPEGMKTLAHQGTKKYQQKFDLLCSNEASRPNEVWQTDHCLLDINLQHNNQIIRPWLTVIIDVYSRAIAGYYLALEPPSSIRVGITLRQAICRKQEPNWNIFGIPETFYTDNGSDFKSEHIETVCANLKIRAVFSIPGKPRGRGKIERFFLTLNQRVLCQLPGYINNINAYENSKNKDTIEKLLTIEELEVHLKNFILNIYHQEKHSITKEAPIERWDKKDFLPQIPGSLEALDLLLLTIPKARKVQQDGIHFQGLKYLDTTLASYIGERVMIRYDPRDITEIRIFHNEKFLCRAICQELSGETISLKDIISARQKRKNELNKLISQKRSIVAQLLYEKHSKVPIEVKNDRALTTKNKKPKIKLYENE